MNKLYFDRGNVGVSETKNTGKKKQDHYEATIKYALTKDDFAFDSLADAKDKTKLDEAIASKMVVPMFSIESSEHSNVEPTYFEARTIKKETSAYRKGLKAKHFLDIFSHSALKSFSDSDYTRIIEFTEDNKMLLVADNGKLKGQSLSEFIVGAKIEPVIAGEPASTTVEIIYKDYNEFEDFAHVVEPSYRLEDVEGVFDVELDGLTASSSEIKFKGFTYDGDEVTNLTPAKIKVYDADGNEQTGLTASYTNGEYVITGTGIVTGYIKSEVDMQTKVAYELVKTDFTI